MLTVPSIREFRRHQSVKKGQEGEAVCLCSHLLVPLCPVTEVSVCACDFLQSWGLAHAH